MYNMNEVDNTIDDTVEAEVRYAPDYDKIGTIKGMLSKAEVEFTPRVEREIIIRVVADKQRYHWPEVKITKYPGARIALLELVGMAFPMTDALTEETVFAAISSRMIDDCDTKTMEELKQKIKVIFKEYKENGI